MCKYFHIASSHACRPSEFFFESYRPAAATIHPFILLIQMKLDADIVNHDDHVDC